MPLLRYDSNLHFRCNDLRRLKIEVGNLFSLRVHHWVAGDPPYLQHAHPWNFITLVLTGGYDDVAVGRPVDRVRAPTVRYRPHTWRHSVTNCLPGTWSVVITGRVVRSWRFWVGDQQVTEEEWNHRKCD